MDFVQQSGFLLDLLFDPANLQEEVFGVDRARVARCPGSDIGAGQVHDVERLSCIVKQAYNLLDLVMPFHNLPDPLANISWKGVVRYKNF